MKRLMKYFVNGAFLAGVLALALVMHQADQKYQARQLRFHGAFGIAIPHTDIERQAAYPIVQEQLAKLEQEASKQDASLAVRRAHLDAWELAMDYRLTTDDQMMEHLTQTMETTFAVSDWVLGKVSRGPSGADILRQYLKSKQPAKG